MPSEPPVTVTVTAEAAGLAESPTSTQTPEPEGAEPTVAPDPDAPDSGVLDENASGQTLSLSDIFDVRGEWSESRFGVSDRSDIRGLGVPVSCFGDGASLEMRLARRFSGLEMSVGQANDSPSSGQVLVVEVEANGEQLDVRRVPFDQVQPIDLDIAGVNALRIVLTLDRGGCGSSDRVLAVVEGLRVS